MMTPENTIYFEAGDADLQQFARILAYALAEHKSFRIHLDVNNGIAALKAKAGEGVWTPSMFGSEDPKTIPAHDRAKRPGSNVIPFPSHLRD